MSRMFVEGDTALSMTQHQRLRRGIPESGFQKIVERLLLTYGWSYYHDRDSRGNPKSGSGFPDIVAIKDGVMLALELKTNKGKVKSNQRAWLKRFESTGAVARVVRPHDIDWLETTLRGY